MKSADCILLTKKINFSFIYKNESPCILWQPYCTGLLFEVIENDNEIHSIYIYFWQNAEIEVVCLQSIALLQNKQRNCFCFISLCVQQCKKKLKILKKKFFFFIIILILMYYMNYDTVTYADL